MKDSYKVTILSCGSSEKLYRTLRTLSNYSSTRASQFSEEGTIIEFSELYKAQEFCEACKDFCNLKLEAIIFYT